MNDQGTDTVAVAVDDQRCIGAGQCEMLDEATFLVDDDTSIATVIGTGRVDRKAAEEIMQRCPSQAISIVEATDVETGDEEE